MKNTIDTASIRRMFAAALHDGDVVETRNGSMIELMGASFIADEPFIFGKVNDEYVKREIKWYESESTNVQDLCFRGTDEVPQAWLMTANTHGEINSNYGLLIYSPKYYMQFNRACNELRQNPNSRRASMIYTRPSIWEEYKENGKNDFICTNSVTYYIRDNKVHAVVQMRSNDVVFGFRNDYAWQKYVLDLVACNLAKHYEGLDVGDIYWQVQNLHVYDRHFYLVHHWNQTNESHITKKKFKELYGEDHKYVVNG